MSKERIHKYTFAVTLLFILGAAGIFVFNTQSPTGYVISTPTPSSPYNGATGISLTPTFSWGATTGAEWYHLYYKKSTETSWQFKSSLTSTSYTFSSSEALSSGTKYNWQVRACKPGPDCQDSNIMSFTTKGGEAVTTIVAINAEAETPTTKPSKCTTYFGDDVCDDSKADCGTYYKSFSMVECDECDTWKDGKLGFDKCVGQEVDEETKCTDSDGGKEPYTKGITTGTNYYSDQLIKEEDLCMLADNPTYENGMFLPGGAIGVKTCSGGDKCYVSEHVCTESYETPKKIVIGSWDIPCPNGCQNGACLPVDEDKEESPTTKPSKCTTYFGDLVCDDSPADCGSYYKSGTSLDACDECQTWKDGKLGFECFEETEVEGEAIIDMLHEGFWKTYTINGLDYEVTLDFVDANIAKFTVNGESTSKLSIGSSDALSNGALITVNKIEYEGTALGVKSAEFSLDVSNATEYASEEETQPGEVKNTLLEGASQMYTINGLDYEVTLDFVDANIAKFIVNSESTSLLSIAKSYKLSNGAIITVKDIFYQTFAGGIRSVEYSLDASNAAEGVTSQKNSCQNSCGMSSGDCWCDEKCVGYEDCCSDYEEFCVGIEILPSFFTVAVYDKGPASDVILMGKVITAKTNVFGKIPVGTTKLFSEVNALGLDNKVTLAIYYGEAVIVVGEHSPVSQVTFALDIAEILSDKDIKHKTILSNEAPKMPSTTLLDLFDEVIAEEETPTQKNTCQNSCGGKSEGDCYCDTACVKYGDCCSDYKEVCIVSSTVASQNNYCNSKSSDGCYCDSVSVQSGYYDFCSDIDTVCGIAKPSGVPAKPGSCKVS